MEGNISTSLMQLVQDIKDDIKRTSNSFNNFSVFSPILWLSAPGRNYCDILYGISLSSRFSPMLFHFFLEHFQKTITQFFLSNLDDPVAAKLILIIGQLICIVPHSVLPNNVNTVLKTLILMPSDEARLGYMYPIFKRAINTVIRLCIVSGANPVPSLFETLKSDSPMDLFSLLEQFRFVIGSASTLCSLLAEIPNLAPTIPPENQTKFLILIYKILSTFFKNYPAIHEKLIFTGLHEAEPAVKAILQWKSTPETEWLPFFCTILPFCHIYLEEYFTNKKSPITPILKGMDEFKSWKSQNRYVAALGFIELLQTNMVIIKSRPSLFLPIKKVTYNIQKKFFQTIIQPDELTPDQLANLVPKYTAIEYAISSGKLDLPGYAYVSSQLNQNNNWKLFIPTQSLIFRGYPLALPVNKVIPIENIQLMKKFFFSLEKSTKKSGTIGELIHVNNDEDRDIANLLITFLAGPDNNFSIPEDENPMLYGKFLNNPDEKVTIPLQMQQYFNILGSPADQFKMLGLVIQMLVSTIPDYVDPYIRLIRLIFSNNTTFLGMISNTTDAQFLEIISQIISDFNSAAIAAILNFSQAFTLLPSLFYQFLQWLEMILQKRHATPKSAAFKPTVKFSMADPIKKKKKKQKKSVQDVTIGDKIVLDKETLNDFCTLIFLLENDSYFKKSVSHLIEVLFENYPKDPEPPAGLVKEIVGRWFGGIKYSLHQDGHAIVFEDGGISKEPTAFLGQINRDQLADLTRFLVQHVYLLTDFIKQNSVVTFENQFFKVCFLYIIGAGDVDTRFANAFSYLNTASLPSFISAASEEINKKASNCQFENAGFWGTIIMMITNFIDATDFENDVENVKNVENLLSPLLSVIQLELFAPKRLQLVRSVCELLKAFYAKNTFLSERKDGKELKTQLIKSQMIYTSCLKTIFEVSLLHTEVIHTVLEFLPDILYDYKADYSVDCPHVNSLSITNGIQSLHSICFYFDSILVNISRDESSSKPELAWSINQIQLCLDELLDHNTEIMWPILIRAIETSTTLFGVLATEALSLLVNASHLVIPKAITAKISQLKNPNLEDSSIKTKNRKDENSDSFSLNHTSSESHVQDTETGIMKLVYETRKWEYIIPENRVDELKNDAVQMLKADDYKILKNPPTQNPDFIKAAASILFSVGQHEFAFSSVTKDFLQSKNLDQFKSFYTGWFKKCAETWSMTSFVQTANSNTKLSFIRHFDPPAIFAYYFKRLFILGCNESTITNIFIECFLRPLLQEPFKYDVPLLTPELTIEEITAHPEFKPLISSLLTSETIYTMPNQFGDQWKADYSVILHYMSDRPPPFDEVDIYPLEGLNPNHLLKSKHSQWLTNIGTTKEGWNALLVSPTKIPDISAESLVYFFSIHSTSPVEVFVNIQKIPQWLETPYSEFRKLLPSSVLSNVKRISFVNASYDSVEFLTKTGKPHTKSIRVIDDLESVLSPSDHIFFPLELYTLIGEKRATFDVTAFGLSSKLSYLQDSLLLYSKAIIFDEPHTVSISIPIEGLTVETKGNGLILKHENLGLEIPIDTPRKKSIQAALTLAIKARVPDNQYRPPRVSAVDALTARALILASTPAAARPCGWRQGLVLLESIFRHLTVSEDDRNVLRKLISAIQIDSNFRIDGFLYLFQSVSHLKLEQYVSLALADYFIRKDPIIPYESLMLLIVDFANRCTDDDLPILHEVFHVIMSLSKKPAWASYLETQFWPMLSSPLALEAVFVLILDKDLNFGDRSSAHSKNLIRTAVHSLIHGSLTYSESKSSSTLLPIVADNSSIISSIIIRLLSGLVRKRPFGRPLAAQRLFSSIATLPFEVDLLHLCDNESIALLLFAALTTVIDRAQESCEDVSTFLKSFVSSAASSLPPDPKFERLERKLSSTLSQPRTLDVDEFIHEMAELSELCGPQIASSYCALFEEDGNPDLWYIKAAASNEILLDPSNLARLVTCLPSLWYSESQDDEFDRSLKLGLAFRALAVAVDEFSNSINTDNGEEEQDVWEGPVFLFWPALAAAVTSNSGLRCSALKLMRAAARYAALGNFSIEQLREDTENNLSKGIELLERKLGLRFKDQFYPATVMATLKGLLEVDSRNDAIEALRALNSGKTKKKVLSLALMAFEEVKPSMKIGTIFDKLENDPCGEWKAVFAIHAFLDRATYHRIPQMGDCVVYLAKRYPKMAVRGKKMILERCLKFIDTGPSRENIAKVTEVAAVYLAMPDEKSGEEEKIDEWLPKFDDVAIKVMLNTLLPALAVTFSFD